MVVQGPKYYYAGAGVAEYRLVASARITCVDGQLRGWRYIFEQGQQLMNKTRHNLRKRTGPKSTRTTEHLVRALVAGCGSPAQVLELYYWSKEPGLIDVIRGIVAMPEETRAALEAFMAISRDAKSVVATLDRCGVLSLTSENAMKTVALAQHAAEDDVDDQPRLLN
jgi:hypothetical protein